MCHREHGVQQLLYIRKWPISLSIVAYEISHVHSNLYNTAFHPLPDEIFWESESDFFNSIPLTHGYSISRLKLKQTRQTLLQLNATAKSRKKSSSLYSNIDESMVKDVVPTFAVGKWSRVEGSVLACLEINLCSCLIAPNNWMPLPTLLLILILSLLLQLSLFHSYRWNIDSKMRHL